MLTLLMAQLAVAGDLDTAATMHTLDNGLRVILEEDHRTDTVALHIWYGVGSRDETDGEFGCAHLFEHLMFEGSKNVGTDMFDTYLTQAGGDNNAFTSNDETAYHMSFPSGALDLALFLESDRLAFLDAGLNADNVANQQLVVLQERSEGYASPHGRDWDAMGKITWPEGHPYHHPVIGRVADIEAFAVDKVQNFWETHYRPENAVLTLVGHFDKDVALERLNHWFSDVPGKGEAKARETAETTDPKGVVGDGYLEDDVEDRTLYAVWNTVPLNHPDAAAMDLLTYVLSYGRGTRLDDKLYFGSNLATSVGAYYFGGEIGGQTILTATSDRTPLVKLDKHMRKIVDQLAKNPPTDDELERFRKAVKNDYMTQLESIEDRAQLLTDCYKHTGEANCLTAEFNKYDAVTPADLVRVAQTYLTPEARSTLSVVPRGDTGAMPGAKLVELP